MDPPRFYLLYMKIFQNVPLISRWNVCVSWAALPLLSHLDGRPGQRFYFYISLPGGNFLRLSACDCHGQRHYIFGLPFHPIVVNTLSREQIFFKFGKNILGHKDELIRYANGQRSTTPYTLTQKTEWKFLNWWLLCWRSIVQARCSIICLKLAFAATSIHSWSIVVHHVLFLVDIRLKVILVAPCNRSLHHSLHVLYKTEIWTDANSNFQGVQRYPATREWFKSIAFDYLWLSYLSSYIMNYDSFIAV